MLLAKWIILAETRAQAAMDRRQRRNPSASSSAFSSPASSSSRFRSEKFSSNPPKTSNSLKDAHQLKSKCGKPQRPEQEEEGEQDPNNLLSLVGTCPFMCPGKNACLFFHFFKFYFPVILCLVSEKLEENSRKEKWIWSLCHFCGFYINFTNKIDISPPLLDTNLQKM